MFYIVEKEEQLEELERITEFNNIAFIKLIEGSNAVHPALQIKNISVIYIRSLGESKGYLLGLDHTELTNSIPRSKIKSFLSKFTNKLIVNNKKRFLYHFPGLHSKLIDINFIQPLSNRKNQCWEHYYRNYNDKNINKLIPISKIYEVCENEYYEVGEIFNEDLIETPQFIFCNGVLTENFFKVEYVGIKLNKDKFIKYYSHLHNPALNVSKGKIYTEYNLYTITSRPTNSFNEINFTALSKDNGEREIIIPENDYLVEIDINGFHPRIIEWLTDTDYFTHEEVYTVISRILSGSGSNVKELTFRQIYGGISDSYKNIPFFKETFDLTKSYWDLFCNEGIVDTKTRVFTRDLEILNPPKLLNYCVQSYETYLNTLAIGQILRYLKDKKSKLIMYTYDAFLIDFSETDGLGILDEIKRLVNFPSRMKMGKNYNNME